MTPSERIAAEIGARISAGRLAPGDRVPSARQIARDFGVAIATATRVLGRLRDEGLVRPVPGVGTVVAGPPARRLSTSDDPLPAHSGPTTPVSGPRTAAPAGRASTASGRTSPAASPSRERIAQAAIRIADVEGIAALSMRRIAAELGVATMSLYRYVQSKDELIALMVDAVYGQHPPQEPPPAGWRAQLSQLALLQWTICQAHPWLARVTSFTRPQLAPGGMAHTEWAMRAVSRLGLDPATSLHVMLTVVAFIFGIATNLESETEAQQTAGISSQQWMRNQEASFDEVMRSGRFPLLRELGDIPDFDLELDTLFEFGLERVLDGLAVFLEPRTA
jgi:AcrR family transcriptional regulator